MSLTLFYRNNLAVTECYQKFGARVLRYDQHFEKGRRGQGDVC